MEEKIFMDDKLTKDVFTPALTPEQVKELTVQVENMETRYFNHCRFTTSFADLRIFLGQNTLSAAGKFVIREELCVVFSPEFAKVISDVLITSIGMYESKFGKIRPRPDQPPEAVIK
jgi:glutaminase